MEKEDNLILNFIEYLKSHGYPDNSLIFEYTIANRYQVDLAVIEPKTKEIIALFEFKKIKDERTEAIALEQLSRIYKDIDDKSIQLYLVYGKDGIPPFEIYNLKQEDKTLNLVPVRISDYLISKNTKYSKILTNNKKNRVKFNNILLFICIVLSAILITLLVLDFIGFIEITINRLIIIGITVALIIIPFANKIRFLGIEWERLQEK